MAVRDPRPWVHAALFGALWGAAEATLGTVLHLARIPFSGMLLGVVALLAMVTARRLEPRVGVCLLAGIVAAFLKVFMLGGFYPGPLIGILVQAVMVELALTTLGVRAVAAATGGAAAFAAGPVQKLAMTWLVAGPEAAAALVAAADRGLSRLGLHGLGTAEVLAAAVASAAALGAAAGLLAWRVSGRVVRRVGSER